ncbi:binding-protein-dependent transport systems inner membrane component [Spirochaetia bacterium]|nr:binding-protein-dependent transport systems inner membrane component [Spirochaetia bacterium]
MRRTLSPPKWYVFVLFLAPILIIYFLNVVAPILISVYYSLFNWTGGLNKSFVGFENYINLAKDTEFWQSAYNNLIIVIMCTVGQVGFALIISFLLISRTLRLKEFHRTVVFFPVTVSALVIGFIWSLMYNKDYGLINFFFRLFGLEKFIIPWLDNPSYVLITASIPVVLQYIGLYMIMFMGAIKSIPEEILECAELDGCNDWQRSLHITLPMIYDTFKVAVMVCVSGTMKIFDHILVLTNGGPGKSSQVLALYGYKMSFDRMKLSYGMTISIGILLLSMVITLGSRKLLGGKQYE